MPVAGDKAASQHMADAAPAPDYDCLGYPLSQNEDQGFSLVPSMVGLSLSLPRADRKLSGQNSSAITALHCLDMEAAGAEVIFLRRRSACASFVFCE